MQAGETLGMSRPAIVRKGAKVAPLSAARGGLGTPMELFLAGHRPKQLRSRCLERALPSGTLGQLDLSLSGVVSPLLRATPAEARSKKIGAGL
jgi:hypothetical protein